MKRKPAAYDGFVGQRTSEIPADLDLECPFGFVKGLSPRMTVFKETIKKQQWVSRSQALGYFQKAKRMKEGSPRSPKATDTIYFKV